MGKAVVDKLKEEYDIEDQWLPLEIHPETPKDGMDILKRFPKSSLDKMTSSLNLSGQKYGIEFKELKVLSNSHLALAAGEYAKEKGKFHELHQKLFYAYFTAGKDIGILDVIADLAEEAGLLREELIDRLKNGYYDHVLNETQAEAHEYGINSTPTFIIDDKYAIVGAQPIEAFREAMKEIEG